MTKHSAGQGYCVCTDTHNVDNNNNNKADTKRPGESCIVVSCFGAAVVAASFAESKHKCSSLESDWEIYQCVNAQTRTHNHTNKLGEVVRLNTLSFCWWCYLFFRSVSFSAFVHVTSHASKCRRGVCLGLKPHLQTHTHTHRGKTSGQDFKER